MEHPEKKERLNAILNKIKSEELDCDLITPEPASVEQIAAVHGRRYIEQVQAIVRWANQHKIALVPSGGRTGLSAAAVAANGEVVVAFDYMNQILAFNEYDRTVVCQPGVVTKQLQQFAEDKGLYYPVDFASSGSSQIGGNIGTNAGGIKVIRPSELVMPRPQPICPSGALARPAPYMNTARRAIAVPA